MEVSVSDPFVIRASSWSSLFDCAHRWEGVHILGMTLPSSPRARLGTAIHASTALYDQSRMSGYGLSISDTADIFVETLREQKEEVDWSLEKDLTIKTAESIGLTLHSIYCSDISPQYEFEAVEMTTEPLLVDCGDGVEILLKGTMDRSRVVKNRHGSAICDLKSGAKAVIKGQANVSGHGAQVGTYEMLKEHTTGTPSTAPAEIIGLKTSGKPEVKVGQIENPKELLVGTEDSPGLMHYAKEFFRSGLFPPNPSSYLCSKKYCARWDSCKFHG